MLSVAADVIETGRLFHNNEKMQQTHGYQYATIETAFT